MHLISTYIKKTLMNYFSIQKYRIHKINNLKILNKNRKKKLCLPLKVKTFSLIHSILLYTCKRKCFCKYARKHVISISLVYQLLKICQRESQF